MKFSIRQIFASVAGAVLAALIASIFGVTGTIIGVAIGAAVATFVTALVAQSIERGHEAVKQVVVRAPESQPLVRRLGATKASGSMEAGLPLEGDETVQTQRTSARSAAVLSEKTAPREVSKTAEGPATQRTAAAPRPAGSTSTRRFSRSAIVSTLVIVFLLALAFVTGVQLLAGLPTVKNIFVPPGGAPTTTTTTTTTLPGSTTTTTGPTPTTSPNTATTTTTAPSTSGTTTTTTGASATTTTTAPRAATTTPSTPGQSRAESGGSAGATSP